MEYKYYGKIRRWVDADTVIISVDLGFKTFRRERFRLARVDTPEIRGKNANKIEGQKSLDACLKIAPEKTPIELHSTKIDKYGRYIAEVTIVDSDVNISDYLIENGFGKEMDY